MNERNMTRQVSCAYVVIEDDKISDVIYSDFLEPNPLQFLKNRGYDLSSPPIREEVPKSNVRDLLAAIDAFKARK